MTPRMIEDSVRRRGIATPAQILSDVRAQDPDECKAVADIIASMVADKKLEFLRYEERGWSVPAFKWRG